MRNNKPNLIGNYAFSTDIGRVRLTNEDQAKVVSNAHGDILLVVCDGMGGENTGELASSITCSHLCEDFIQSRFTTALSMRMWLNRHISKVNKYVYKQAKLNNLYKGMGTTLTCAIIHANNLVFAQIGDSRLYTIENNDLKQLTEDQTYVSFLYKTGQITFEEAKTHPRRHVLSNALGPFPSVDIAFGIRRYNGEKLLLCSDGLYNNASERTISSILKGNDSPREKIKELINIANSNGGSDNIAIVIWEASYAD